MDTSDLPQIMRSLALPRYMKPSEYEIMDLPLPSIENPDDVLVRVHASSLLTAEPLVASGAAAMVFPRLDFPMKLGLQAAGVVLAVGSGVTSLKSGDSVYGMAAMRPAPLRKMPGHCSEYAVLKERLLLPKPANLSFEEALALLGATLTAYQVGNTAIEALRQRGIDSLEGLTVFVPAALSATGAPGIQVLKKVFRVGRIITTVSTPKLKLVEQHLPGLVDQVIDYTTTPRLESVIEPGSVDFVYDTRGNVAEYTPLLNRQHGVMVSIACIPPSSILKQTMGDLLPFWLGWFADMAQWYYRWKMSGGNRDLRYVSGNGNAREDYEKAGELIAKGDVKAVVMTIVGLEDIEALRKAVEQLLKGKGGLGPLMIKIV